jgi:hypothetical protein
MVSMRCKMVVKEAQQTKKLGLHYVMLDLVWLKLWKELFGSATCTTQNTLLSGSQVSPLTKAMRMK